MGQVAAVGKALAQGLIKRKAGNEDIARDQPERIVERRQCAADGAAGLDAAAEIQVLAGIDNLQLLAAQLGQRRRSRPGVGYLLAQPAGIDEQALDAGAGQLLHAVLHQRLALHGKQWLGGVVRQGPHALATASGQHHRLGAKIRRK
jgi:hypothetical protein